MTLAQRLAAIRASDLEETGPPEVQEIMARCTAELGRSGLAGRALGVGDRAPDFELTGSAGTEAGVVRSAELRAQGPLVLSFYRGVW